MNISLNLSVKIFKLILYDRLSKLIGLDFALLYGFSSWELMLCKSSCSLLRYDHVLRKILYFID